MSRAFKRIITRSLWPILVSSQLSHFLFSQLRIPQILQFEFQFISNRWKGVGILRAHSVWKLTKMSYLKFSIFVLLIVRCLVTLFDRKLQVFKNSPKLTIFNKFFPTQNVNVARFARKIMRPFLWFSNNVHVFVGQWNRRNSTDIQPRLLGWGH